MDACLLALYAIERRFRGRNAGKGVEDETSLDRILGALFFLFLLGFEIEGCEAMMIAGFAHPRIGGPAT